MKKIFYSLILIILIIFIWGLYFYNSKYNSEVIESQQISQTQISVSTIDNCTKLKGVIENKKYENGDQFQICFFEDNRGCEVKALLNGNCPVGGLKVTGYDTVDEMYCRWSGNEVDMNTQGGSTCILKDKKSCTTKEFYQGQGTCFGQI